MEIYSRFLYQKSLYSKNPPRVKPTAFPIGEDGKVSVYQTDGLDDSAVWGLGKELNSTRSLHGRGELLRADIESVELAIQVEGPHPLHRNITGWVADELDQLSQQQLLANKATLRLCE
jgi:hypothetical protein